MTETQTCDHRTDQEIHARLADVMRAVRGVGKGETAQAGQTRFQFRGIDAVLNAVGPALRDNNVYLLPEVISEQHDTVPTRNGGTMLHVVLTVAYHFVSGYDGSRATAVVFGESSDAGDKAYSKAMSVALRTALIQTLALPTDEPDPDLTQFERVAPPEPLTVLRDEYLGLVTSLGYDPVQYGAAWKERTGSPKALSMSEDGLTAVIETLKAEQVVRATTGATHVTPGTETPGDVAIAQDEAEKS